jgi:hypothetical protein
MTGTEKYQPKSILVSVTVHDAAHDAPPDDPLPTTRECEKKTRATIHATMARQTIANPSRRRGERVISVMPPNEKS